nr:hypothetical protein BCU03_07075 [Vibrio breoganii]
MFLPWLLNLYFTIVRPEQQTRTNTVRLFAPNKIYPLLSVLNDSEPLNRAFAGILTGFIHFETGGFGKLLIFRGLSSR